MGEGFCCALDALVQQMVAAQSTRKNCVAIAASAGGIPQLQVLLRRIPADFNAPILIAQHSSPMQGGLPGILARRCALPVFPAVEGVDVEPGRVYVAAAGEHVIVEGGKLKTLGTERRNFVRPSADLLFQSVAAEHGSGAIGVVLSGLGRDGAKGARAIKHAGGTVLTADQSSSQHFGMPEKAIRTGCVDLALPVTALADALVALVQKPEVRAWFSVPACPEDRYSIVGSSLLLWT